MSEKKFKGKVIYNPSGKAGEYSYWAANFYNGCSGDCSYCYCKKYPMSQFWNNKPTLKKSLVDFETAIDIFVKEVDKNIESLEMDGLFFSFTSDPFLKETYDLVEIAIDICLSRKIPVKILTKQAWWVSRFVKDPRYKIRKKYIAIGFTLTGYDKLEPGCATNQERVDGIKILHEAGFKTFASIEPIIDIESSVFMIKDTSTYCDHYKIGIDTTKEYNPDRLKMFIIETTANIQKYSYATIYWKDETLKKGGVLRKDLLKNCVNRDFNIFKND
jgi:DNA repair photolyase